MRSPFTLPAFGECVPAKLCAGSGDERVRRVARSLLDGGVLQSGDWRGDVPSSLSAGIARLIEESGVNTWRFFQMEAFFSTAVETHMEDLFSLETMHLEETVRLDGVANVPREPGMWGFKHDPYLPLPRAHIGARLADVETRYPGAGYAVMGVLSEVIEQFGGMTPRRAHELATDWKDMACDPELEGEEYTQETGQVCPTAFRHEMPLRAYKCQMSARVLQRALERAEVAEPHSHTCDALEMALSLTRRVQSARRRFKRGDLAKEPVFHLHAESVVPLFLSWGESDCSTDVGDSFLNDLSGYDGDCTDVVWYSDFDARSPAQTVAAAKRFVESLRMLSMCDQLLFFLHSTQVAPTKIKRPRRAKSLLQVLEALDAKIEVQAVQPRVEERVRCRI